MSSLNRRALLLVSTAVIAVPLLLAACSGTGTTTPAQIIADANGLVAVLQTDLPLIVAIDPALMTPARETALMADLDEARALAITITPALPAVSGATSLQTVEATINIVLDGLAAVANAAPGTKLSAYTLPVEAAMILAQGIEAYVNATLATNAVTASLRAKAVAPKMTPAQARAALGIKVAG